MKENNSINEGKLYLLKNDYDSAIRIFLEGFKDTSNPIFIIYIAICYYKRNDYLIALDYLEQYEVYVSDNLEICYLFLAAIYKEINNKQMCYYYYQKFLGKEASTKSESFLTSIIDSYGKIIDNKVAKTYKLLMSNDELRGGRKHE